jgi:DNA-binding transcriptional regulator YhcF (GntR family)
MSNYFNRLPDFDYVSRLPDAKISDYIRVKNLFKKGKLREDIFQDLTFFTKYEIVGNDRPDNVAFKEYNDSNLDWVVLQSNNIINIQTEWPLSQRDFDRYMLEKYSTYDNLYNGIHHYETVETKNSKGVVIIPGGQQVPSDYSVTFYDDKLEQMITSSEKVTVTNYQYEEKIQENKRNIFLLKPDYLPLILDDMEDFMPYRKGSTQYVSETLKRADNIRLYD